MDRVFTFRCFLQSGLGNPSWEYVLLLFHLSKNKRARAIQEITCDKTQGYVIVTLVLQAQV